METNALSQLTFDDTVKFQTWSLHLFSFYTCINKGQIRLTTQNAYFENLRTHSIPHSIQIVQIQI